MAPDREPGARAAWRADLGWVVAAALILLRALGSPSPAAAAAPRVPSAQGLSVHPALSGETTLPHGHFTYALPPGGRIGDALIVQSSESAPERVQVYGADLLALAGGGVTPAAAGQTMHGVGDWLVVEPPARPVPAGGRLRVPFTLSVPQGAAPGSYDGAVVAQGRVGTTASGIPVGVRLALVVHVTVVAAVAPDLTLGPLAGSRAGKVETLALRLRNRGNVSLGVAGAVVVRDGVGVVVGRASLGPTGLYVVPGGSAVLHGSFVWPRGLAGVTAVPVVTTTVGVRPGPAYSGPPQLLGRPRALPWVIPAVAATLIAAGFALRRSARPGLGGNHP